jgi:hypothetical protein
MAPHHHHHHHAHAGHAAGPAHAHPWTHHHARAVHRAAPGRRLSGDVVGATSGCEPPPRDADPCDRVLVHVRNLGTPLATTIPRALCPVSAAARDGSPAHHSRTDIRRTAVGLGSGASGMQAPPPHVRIDVGQTGRDRASRHLVRPASPLGAALAIPARVRPLERLKGHVCQGGGKCGGHEVATVQAALGESCRISLVGAGLRISPMASTPR